VALLVNQPNTLDEAYDSQAITNRKKKQIPTLHTPHHRHRQIYHPLLSHPPFSPITKQIWHLNLSIKHLPTFPLSTFFLCQGHMKTQSNERNLQQHRVFITYLPPLTPTKSTVHAVEGTYRSSNNRMKDHPIFTNFDLHPFHPISE